MSVAPRIRPALLLGGAVLLGAMLAGCDDANMYAQRKSETWDSNTFLRKGTIMQLPVPGTLARNEPNQPVPQPPVITAALIERGAERYNIFCTPCHGLTGAGDGMIVQRGFPHPPAFTIERLRTAKAQHFYDVMTDGKGVMFSYADRVSPADRWAVAAYIRALQLSQAPDVAALTAADKAKLGAPAGGDR